MYDLKRLQKTELDMLVQIHNVCEALGIKYVILYGTLLGAIRHEGFIPWDDDIDIIMNREDYDLFLREGQKLLPNNLLVQHYSIEPEAYNYYIKVRNTNTLFLENDNKSFNMCHGIFVDIFPFDRISSFCFIPKIEYYRRKLFNITAGCYSIDYIDSIRNPLKKKFGLIIHHIFCSKCSISTFFGKEEAFRRKMNSHGRDTYLLDFFAWKGTVSYEDLFVRQLYLFEGFNFYGPKNSDKILKQCYGSNYMELPPVESRITHQPLVVDFDINS